MLLLHRYPVDFVAHFAVTKYLMLLYDILVLPRLIFDSSLALRDLNLMLCSLSCRKLSSGR